jgi:hypothetical protein
MEWQMLARIANAKAAPKTGLLNFALEDVESGMNAPVYLNLLKNSML